MATPCADTDLTLSPTDDAAQRFKTLMAGKPEVLSVTWTHHHYVKDDEYIPYGEDITTFLAREIGKPIIRWEDSPQPGYEILPNKYFYRYQPPPARQLHQEYGGWRRRRKGCLEGLNGGRP